MQTKFLTVWINPRARRITLQRYLVSKLVCEIGKFEDRDLLCLFENQLWLEQAAHQNEDFLEKFGKSLEVLSKHLKEVNFKMDPTDRAYRRLQMRLKHDLTGFYYPQRNYLTLGKRYEKLFRLQEPQPVGKQLRYIKPPRRVGKGYTDKGTLRNTATNGTPSWQEVAAHSGPIYDGGVSEGGTNVSEAVENPAVKLIRIIKEL